jgi:uncharacterized cupin superfamily protein
MEISVRKPTEKEVVEMQSKSVWRCDVSEFDWYYDSEEICLIIEGEVTVTYDGKSVLFAEGDYVVFSKGLSCVWQVTRAVKK